MTKEAKAKIQEALDDYKYVLIEVLQYPSMSRRFDALEDAIEALNSESVEVK